MDNSNCVTLVKELCESFLISSGIRVSPKMLNNLTQKALSTVFTFYDSNSDIPSKEAYSAIKADIISSSLVGEFTKASIASIEQCVHDLEEQCKNENAKDDLYSLFLFLYKVSQISRLKDPSECSNKLKRNIHDTNNNNASFTGSNWDIFYHDPCGNTPTFNYPFYEEPGTDIKFIKDYCPVTEPFIEDFSKLFQRNNKIWELRDDKTDNTIAQDEGFVTPGSQFSYENEEQIDNNSDDCSSYSDYLINDDQYLKLNKQTWEQLGNCTYHPEKPFASEVPETIIHFWKISNACENPKKKTFSIDQELLITFDELKNDIRFLLFGMESSSFFYNSITRVFYMRDKLHLKTITPELLNDFCRPAMDCASFYYCLKTFVEQRSNLHFGPIHKVFCRCLYQILNVYRCSLLNMGWEYISYMLQLEPLITPLLRKLQFLIKLCLITIGEEANSLNFPSGVQLLDYLYNNMTRVFRPDFGFLLFHFFESCCNVYLKVVSEWMFEGCFSNLANYEEFFIDIQREDEICRDWRRVSCIKVKEKRVPKILEDFYKDIFLCGKSVNLLKIFTTRDVLETILQKNHPDLKCCFNKRQLDEYTAVWREYQAVNNKNFCSKERIKDKLTKTYGPEFYIHIKQVREEWFARHQSIIELPADSTVLATCEKHEEIVEKLENVSLIEDEKSVVPVELKTQEENAEQLVPIQTKTKRLVQFFDSLSSPVKDSHENTRRSLQNTPTKISISGTQLQGIAKREDKAIESVSEAISKIERESSPEVNNLSTSSPGSLKKTGDKIRKRDSITSIDDSEFFSEPHTEPISSQNVDNPFITNVAHLPVHPSESEIHFSDYKCGVDQASDVHSKSKELVVKSKPAISSPLSFSQIGCGDFATTEIPSLKSRNSVLAAASGDATPSFEERSSIIEETSLDSSSVQTQLNDTLNELQNEIRKKRTISDHDCNKLKVMSSDYQKQLSETNGEATKTIFLETPLTIRDMNRRKVMSSEYHLRLSSSKKLKIAADPVKQLKNRELSECEEDSSVQTQLNDTVNELQNEKRENQTLSDHDYNKLKVMSSDYQKQLSETNGETTKPIFLETPLTVRDINRRKVMSSEYHLRLSSCDKSKITADSVEQPKKRELNECEEYSRVRTQLNDTVNELQSEKRENQTLSDHDCNKLKVMSSDYQKQLSETNGETTKTIFLETPLTIRDINRRKVMSSEYHLRLSSCDKSKITADSVEQPKKRELSECEKNKLKVMSSEYHVRLQESLNPSSENTESDSGPVVLSERDINKLKVMSSEYHNRLAASPVIGKTKLPQPVEMQEDSCDVDKSVCCSENIRQTFEELETISEDVSEDPVTIIENNEYCQPSLPDDEKCLKRPSNLFLLENYVTYGGQSFSCFKKETFDDLKAAADSVCDVDRSSLLYYLAQSIVIPLRIQSRIVNEAVLRVFIDEEGYLNHLMTLRNYMFLRKPEFSLLLTNTVFKMAETVKKPYMLLNNYTLSCILQQALLAANSKEAIVFERKLSLFVENAVPKVFDLTDIKALNNLSLSYSVKWPINVLITEPILKKYTRIFKFLMQIQRASWVLKNDFKKLKNLKRGKSIQYMQIQLYRYNMMHAVRIIQEFVVREGLESCWNDLTDYLTSSEISLDDLYLSHLKYINKIMQRCFLCDLSLTCHQSILNVLSSVLKYHVALRSGKWQRNEQVNFLYHTNFKNIHVVYEEFQKCLNDVRTKLKVLVYVKQRRYFEPLLFELCKNTAEGEKLLET